MAIITVSFSYHELMKTFLDPSLIHTLIDYKIFFSDPYHLKDIHTFFRKERLFGLE